MRLGDLLIRAKLVTEEDVTRALARMGQHGGRLGDNLVAIGALDQKALERFIHRIPAEPADIVATGIDENELMGLMLKLVYTTRLANVRQYVETIKLPLQIVLDLVRMAVDRAYLHTLGSRNSDSLLDMSYAFTDEGRRWTIDALGRNGYLGPAPVTLDEFNDQVNLQKLTNELVTMERIRKAIGDLSFEDRILEQAGPALNSGRAMLLYGPPGNGKTSVAMRLAGVFQDVIYVPYAVIVEGQIIRIHDPSVHMVLSPTKVEEDDGLSFVRREAYDARWVPCQRPFIITGGELTLEMLDLQHTMRPKPHTAKRRCIALALLGGCFPDRRLQPPIGEPHQPAKPLDRAP